MTHPLERLVEHVRHQARACHALGSPFYGVLLTHVADDVEARGPAADVLRDHVDDPGPAAVALRLVGTAHRLALAGQAPDLAAHLPSTGGDGDPDATWPALRTLLETRAAEVRAGLELAPQTNETGRSAALLGALLHVVGPEPLPVRLWELGTSGGLNLLADRFRYVASDGGTWGPDSAVVLDPAWDVVPEGAPSDLDVIERVGGDLSPVDPTTPEGALRLESYVWPDQDARLARLRAAIEIARAVPVRRVRARVAELLDTLELVPGALTAVWHSLVWQYVPREEQERVTARLDHLGGFATPTSPLVHVAFEPRHLAPGTDYRFVISARTWPGGEERLLGEAPPHGIPVTWGTPS